MNRIFKQLAAVLLALVLSFVVTLIARRGTIARQEDRA